MPVFSYRTRIDAPAEEVFAWHSRPGALERLTPPWERIHILQHPGNITDGARARFITYIGPLPVRWTAEHRDFVEGRQFRDVQIAGPFARWEHTHLIEPDGPSACFLEDQIEYELPFSALSGPLGNIAVRARLQRLFTYRHRTIAQDLAAHRAYTGGKPMRVLITGSSGMIGTALVSLLTTGGHSVTRLVRRQPRPDANEAFWDPATGSIDAAGLEGHDAVVHLAGEELVGRWTAAKKQRILDSRVRGTRLLVESIASLSQPPRVLVSASAVGYYGDRGAEVLTEESPSGSAFLSEVCRQWEAATQPASEKGIRVVNARMGIVLTPAGGALAKMLLPYRMGVGGVVGSGQQYWSWISLDDVITAIYHVLATDSLSGPVNIVSPNPVTNEEFTRTLGKVLGRPTIFPLPAFAARAVFGELADEMLLASARVLPARLTESGYSFRHPQLEGALRHLLGK